MNNGQTEKGKRMLPPYVPYKTLTNFIEQLSSTGLPSHIDKSVMPSMSGGMQSYLLVALRSMGLIDETGQPTSTLDRLIKSKGEDRKVIYREVFEATYRFLSDSGMSLTQTTPVQLNKALEDVGATGDTTTKCRSFLLAFAKDVGIPLSPFLQQRSRKLGPRKTRSERASKGQDLSDGDFADDDVVVVDSRSYHDVLMEILDPATMNEEEMKAVWTLLLYLKKRPQPQNE